jgi:hypothetical protein
MNQGQQIKPWSSSQDSAQAFLSSSPVWVDEGNLGLALKLDKILAAREVSPAKVEKAAVSKLSNLLAWLKPKKANRARG